MGHQASGLQRDRQRHRNRHGRYAEYHRCELCGRPAGDYRSDPRCNRYGVGVVLCAKCARRLTAMNDSEFLRSLGREGP